MNAFVGHSFDSKDKSVVDCFISFLTRNGILYEDGEKPQNKDISDKIKRRIDGNQIFVGIFTIDQEIKQVNKKSSWWERMTSKNKEVPPLFTTSNWVIQESGYAIAKNKELIFLVENGIYKFPELQGDLEITPFDRNSLDKAELKLLSIIHAIKTGEKVLKTVTDEISSQEENPVEKEQSQGLPWSEFFDALDKSDIGAAENIYTKKIRPPLSQKRDCIFWDAYLLFRKYSGGDASALNELRELAEKNKSYDAYYHLAECYNFVNKNLEAIEITRNNIALARNTSEKVDCFLNIAGYYCDDKQYEEAINTLMNIVNILEYKEFLEKIYLKLVDISKVKNDDNLYIMFSEKSLSINPVNTTLHFNLGLKYLNLQKNDLGVYHYKKLINIEDGGMTFNNIAVGYGRLELDAKEAHYLEKALEKKETSLPFANISQKYLNEGFTSLAEKLLREADSLSSKGIEVVENVGTAKSRLKKILEDEDKKEKEILDLAEKIHRFRVRHADAYCFKKSTGEPIDIAGSWNVSGKWDVSLTFDKAKGTFYGKSVYEVEKGSGFYLGWASALGYSLPKEKQYNIVEVEINGTLKNFSGNYTIKVTEREKETPTVAFSKTLLSGSSEKEVYSASGLLIINDETNCIEVFEENNKNEKLFLKWEKKNSK